MNAPETIRHHEGYGKLHDRCPDCHDYFRADIAEARIAELADDIKAHLETCKVAALTSKVAEVESQLREYEKPLTSGYVHPQFLRQTCERYDVLLAEKKNELAALTESLRVAREALESIHGVEVEDAQ